MELLIILAVVFGVGIWWMWKERKHEASESHPLDGATRAPDPIPVVTEVIESVITEAKPKAKKTAPKKAKVEKDSPKKAAPKKAAAKKPAAKKTSKK